MTATIKKNTKMCAFAHVALKIGKVKILSFRKNLLALGIAAGGAVVAAFLVDQHVGALRALAGHVLGQAVVFQFGLGLAVDVLFQHAGNGVRAGEN